MTAAPRLFAFGLGYTALALAGRLRAEGSHVAGTSRRDEEVRSLRARGLEAYRFERAHPLSDAARLLTGAHVLISAPPDELGDPVLAAHGRDLAELRPAWIGYLSTTGVYGDRGGDTVDESSPLSPTGARGRARVAAEQAWLALHREAGLPVHIFRLAGIYGPGRNALTTVRAGQARRIVKRGQVFSRIHVDDIAGVLRASIDRPRPGAIYNVCDDDPAPPQDVIAFACDLLGVPPPPEVPYEKAAATMSEMARSFYADNKRVSNTLIKTELGVRLAYPDYRAGLRALHAAGDGR
jgi:nucleoside-diphosphate-sugar epimerase